MSTVIDGVRRMDTTVSADVLERLHEQRMQIDELFDGFVDRGPGTHEQASDAGRAASLICTLLRVHAALEAEVLVPAIQWAGGHRLLHIATLRRNATLEQIDRTEALPPGGQAHRNEMQVLWRVARAWFDFEEGPVFQLARHLRLDLHRLDRMVARRQERLLTVGPLF